MNPLKWFRRTRPTPHAATWHGLTESEQARLSAEYRARLDPRELTILRWHNLTPAQWTALTNHERANHRNAYMKVTMP